MIVFSVFVGLLAFMLLATSSTIPAKGQQADRVERHSTSTSSTTVRKVRHEKGDNNQEGR